LAIDFLIDFHGKLNQLEILKKIQNQYLCYLIDYNQYSMLRVVVVVVIIIVIEVIVVIVIIVIIVIVVTVIIVIVIVKVIAISNSNSNSNRNSSSRRSGSSTSSTWAWSRQVRMIAKRGIGWYRLGYWWEWCMNCCKQYAWCSSRES